MATKVKAIKLPPTIIAQCEVYTFRHTTMKQEERLKTGAGDIIKAYMDPKDDDVVAEGGGFKVTFRTGESGGTDWEKLAMKLGATPKQIATCQKPGARKIDIRKIP